MGRLGNSPILIGFLVAILLFQIVSFSSTNLPTAYAQSLVPNWVKDNAGWWADGSITDQDFVLGIEYLIEIGVIIVQPTQTTGAETEIPSWIKDNAKWWSQDLITENDFILGLQYLIEVGIINIQTDDKLLDIDPEVSEKAYVIMVWSELAMTWLLEIKNYEADILDEHSDYLWNEYSSSTYI